MRRKLLLSAFMVIAIGGSPSIAQNFRDDFETFHNYATGTVPAGGIWDGVHNPTNGGDPSDPNTEAVFVADGADFAGVPRPDVLFMEDLALHPNTDGTFGAGWEGDKTNAPFLYKEVDAEATLQATVKIDAQTIGNWSSGGILLRVKNDANVGLGPGDVVPGDEAFTSVTAFAPNTALQTTNVYDTDGDGAPNEVETNTAFGDVIAGLVGFPPGVDLNSTDPQDPMPMWIRMIKQGDSVTPAASINGVDFFNGPAVVNPALGLAGNTLEVGLTMMSFVGGEYNWAEFDFFDLEVSAPAVRTESEWTAGGSGNYNTAGNWTSNVPGTPNSNLVNVTFGQAITAPSTVYLNNEFTAKSLTFDNANTYAIAGTNTLTLESDSGNAGLSVVQGSHEIQAKLTLASDTDASVAADSRLDINNLFDLAGNTLTLSGDGVLNINNNLDSGAGGAVVNAGKVGGSGRVNGSLTNSAGGAVQPGTSVGTLTVDGAFTQESGATLAIELGGINDFDILDVLGTADLDGSISVSLVDGYAPSLNDTFEVLTASSISGSLSLAGLLSNNFSVAVGASSLMLTVINDDFPTGPVTGDYNGNGVVDAADYTVWRDSLGSTTDLTADGDGNGTVDQGDFAVWKSNFGATSAVASGAAVPEPGAVLLALLAVAGVALSRVRRS